MKIIVEEIVVPGKREKIKLCRIVLTTMEQREYDFNQVHTLVRETAKQELQAKRLGNMGIVCSPTSTIFSFCPKDEEIFEI